MSFYGGFADEMVKIAATAGVSSRVLGPPELQSPTPKPVKLPSQTKPPQPAVRGNIQYTKKMSPVPKPVSQTHTPNLREGTAPKAKLGVPRESRSQDTFNFLMSQKGPRSTDKGISKERKKFLQKSEAEEKSTDKFLHGRAKQTAAENPGIFGKKVDPDAGRARASARAATEKTLSSGMSAKDIIGRYAFGEGDKKKVRGSRRGKARAGSKAATPGSKRKFGPWYDDETAGTAPHKPLPKSKDRYAKAWMRERATPPDSRLPTSRGLAAAKAPAGPAATRRNLTHATKRPASQVISSGPKPTGESYVQKNRRLQREQRLSKLLKTTPSLGVGKGKKTI